MDCFMNLIYAIITRSYNFAVIEQSIANRGDLLLQLNGRGAGFLAKYYKPLSKF